MDRFITSPEPAAEIALSWTSTGMAPSSGKVLRRLASLADEMSSADGGPISWSWLVRLALTIPNLPVPSRLLSQSERRLLKVYRLARASGLFDAGWYVSQYPDAGADGVDPLRHFLERGAARGHLPSPLWRGLDTESCAALAERHGRPGRLFWRHIRTQRGPGAETFLTASRLGLELTTFGPVSAVDFARALDRGRATHGTMSLDLLIIDHAMGGGANRYRDEQLAEALRPDRTVALLTYRVAQDRYLLDLCDGDSYVAVTATSRPEVERVLLGLGIGRILLNNLVSYPDVRAMTETIREVAARTGAAVTFPLHDYFAVCPSFNLLDQDGQFCGVPDLSRCRACLAEVDLPAPVLDVPRDIDAWRAAWSHMLGEADEIVAFSATSRTLLARAYPNLAAERVCVRPHTVDYMPDRTVALDRSAPLHIGVVGEISYAKGAEIVAALDDLMRRTGTSARLSVIGTLDRRHGGQIAQTGRYRTADLPDLLAEHEITVCLIPSIWPETFCYVAEELLRLGMPVAAFDLGAPAERLRDHPLGLVLTSREPDRMLAELEAFWHGLCANRSPVAVPDERARTVAS